MEDSNRLLTLLGQAVWHTQHLELVMTQYNSLMTLQDRKKCGEVISENDVNKALAVNKAKPLKTMISKAKEQGSLPKPK